MMNCFTLATGTPSPPGSESGSSRPVAGPISPPRRRASPSALSARPRSWRSSVPWPWSPRGVGSSWPRTRAPRPCGSRLGTCRRGRPCATPRSRATGAGGREVDASPGPPPCDRANRARTCRGAPRRCRTDSQRRATRAVAKSSVAPPSHSGGSGTPRRRRRRGATTRAGSSRAACGSRVAFRTTPPAPTTTPGRKLT